MGRMKNDAIISFCSPQRLSALGDDQVPCSGWFRQRVRLETEQPTWLIQVPWITWSSPSADHRWGAVSLRNA